VTIEKEKVRQTIIAPRTIRAGVYGGRDPAENLEHGGIKGTRNKGRDGRSGG
jgi:hypothetical protein